MVKTLNQIIMRTFIFIVLISASLLSFRSQITYSIYTKHFTSLDGTEINLSQFQGKKMLLVNLASESPYAAVQIPQLEQLYQQYKDSLIVLGFFSNDFSNEPREDNMLKPLMQDTYHATFPTSVRVGVKDSSGNTHPIYTWLQNQSENGMMNVKVKNDFQKYLVEKDGTLIAVFAGKLNPLDPRIINAITQ